MSSCLRAHALTQTFSLTPLAQMQDNEAQVKKKKKESNDNTLFSSFLLRLCI